MPQIISPNGILLGNGTYVFSGGGDPGNRTDFPANIAQGSLYLRNDPPDSTHGLYVYINGAWVAK